MITMLLLAGSLTVVGLILVLNQLLWQRDVVRGEAARKLAHISIGSFIAVWPVYLSYAEIQLALLIGLIGAGIVRHFVVFPSIFDVKRRSIGDIAAPLVILLIAFIEPTKTIFAVTVLHVAFADGMAALVGSRFGHKTAYNIVKQKKSLAGTATFFVASMLIMTAAAIFQSTMDAITIGVYIVVIPVVATILENVSPKGFDNITVPLAVIGILLLAG